MKKLYRSRSQRMLGGVCGGLAEYFSIDTVLVRILWLLALAMGGAGVIVYIIAWILIPEQPSELDHAGAFTFDADRDSPAPGRPEQGSPESSQKRASLAGFILIALGALFLLREFLPFWDLGRLWPLVLIAVGVALLYRGVRGEGR